jgi:hypothetical protein
VRINEIAQPMTAARWFKWRFLIGPADDTDAAGLSREFGTVPLAALEQIYTILACIWKWAKWWAKWVPGETGTRAFFQSDSLQVARPEVPESAADFRLSRSSGRIDLFQDRRPP